MTDQVAREAAAAEVFTNEAELFWLTTAGRTLFEAVAIVAQHSDDQIGFLEATKIKGRVERRENGELWFSADEDGDVEVWRIEVADA